MRTRTLGHSGIEVSAIGFGCWAIGGPFTAGGKPAGWGVVDDEESIAAIRRALELGVTFFDTADVLRSDRTMAKSRQRPEPSQEFELLRASAQVHVTEVK